MKKLELPTQQDQVQRQEMHHSNDSEKYKEKASAHDQDIHK